MSPRSDTTAPAAPTVLSSPATGRRSGETELIAFLAMSMALAALGIDLLLPAYDAIRADLGMAADATAVTGLITAYFLGLAIGQLIYGPIADRYGRKRALSIGYVVYALGAVATAVGPTLAALLVARFVWGLGAAGPRVVTLAIVRDTYEGERMAKAMSFIMAVFLMVPVVAPSIGAAAVQLVSWRWVVAGCAVAVAAATLWARRIPETLAPEHQLPMTISRIAGAARTVLSNRQTASYMLGMTGLYGVFASYLASSQPIFSQVFDAADLFPIVFGGLAIVMGAAMVTNARIVERIGTRRLAHVVLLAYIAVTTGMLVIALVTGGRPPLWLFLTAMAVLLVTHALMIPNFNTIAMAPMGAIAGTASAVIGATQLAAGALLGALIDRTFAGTILPLAWGFVASSLLALACVLFAERGRLFQPLMPTPTPRARAEALAEHDLT